MADLKRSAKMRTWARIGLAIIGSTVVAWTSTAYWGPAKLRRQLVAAAEGELRSLEATVKKQDPTARSAQEVFATRLPIVKVAFLRCPAPFIFEAQTEVFILPDSGEKMIARYVFMPWRVYQRDVEDRRIIVPPLSDPAWAFTDKEAPNQPPQRNAGSRPSSGDSPASETPSSLGPRG